ncbi:MAG: methionyl-tRNA formyltransferase [Gammaproteobacteria bacterium]|nr:methionyl-tRNA formyltransferase [Gammaproteobacteria bacterium]MDH3983571.1 methionyl-tRNA formyltransferase [Gammaproteobacteria bacterium]
MTRLVFAGTPEFAQTTLQALVESGRAPVAVLTQPDRPAGRGKKMTASPVKQYAASQDIPVLQPSTLRDEAVVTELRALCPDVFIVAAYGLILPQNVLDIPTHGCLNVHASVLPRWRGAAPIQAAILAGDETTGISLMAMTAGLDCGPVYHIDEVSIGAAETAGELHDRLAELGGRSLVAHLDAIVMGDMAATAQDESLATYAPKIEKNDAALDWSLPAEELARRVRAYNPFPGAFCFAGDTRIKVWRATAVEGSDEPGKVLQSDRDGVIVACGAGLLQLDELQLPGKRRVAAQEFAGQIDLAGQRLE